MDCWQALVPIVNKPELEWLFKPDPDARVWNETPIEYSQANISVYGIIDRLIVNEHEVHIIDYKSHRISDASTRQKLCEHYRPQLAMYCEGVARLWPGKQIKAWLLFTHTGELVEV
jgi:ATP-dependent helicase/nuclease subunit A